MAESVRLVGVDEVQDYLQQLPDAFYEDARTAISETVFRGQERVQDRIKDGAGDTLHSRTGSLRRSIRGEVHGETLRELYGTVYSAERVAPYAPVHEEGATIRAQNAYQGLPGGPYLNIPAADNLTPAGVQRETAREVFDSGAVILPIDAPSADYGVFKEGWLDNSNTVDLLPMFWLVKQVEIPPRLKMVETLEDEVPTLLNRLDALVEESIRE